MGAFRLLLATVCMGAMAVYPQRVGTPTGELTNLSVEELFSVQVTSVGRKAQQLSRSPAAVYVLSAEEIRRSGATSIPEALRWVPGLTVSRLDGRSWVVSARGSGRLYSNKILVMIDGRSLYTPLFSGVVWDSIDVPLEDIAQIEVIRGPGTVVWGPNAVNGVINIITKRTKATTGAEVSVTAGNELRTGLFVRWGDVPRDTLSYRIWGKLEQRTPSYSSPGYYFHNNKYVYQVGSLDGLDSTTGRAGFRLDWQPNKTDEWLLQGDIYKLSREDPVTYPILLPGLVEFSAERARYEGGSIQGRWSRTKAPGMEDSVQFSFDRNELGFPYLTARLNNITIDYQRRRTMGERNELYWGGGFQQYWDSTASRRSIWFTPEDSSYRAGNVIVRDEMQLLPGRLLLSAGIRLDYNSYGNFEHQPSLRLLYTPNAKQSVWFGFSRAVRVPSRYDRDLRTASGQEYIGGAPLWVGLAGSRTTRSEIERSIEAGYRLQSGQRWSLDVALFRSVYRNLRILRMPSMPEIVSPRSAPPGLLPLVQESAGLGRSYGGEFSATWHVRPSWKLAPAYSYLNQNRWLPRTAANWYTWEDCMGGSPHQVLLRSSHDLSERLQLDLMGRARSRNKGYELPGAVLADARVSWRFTRSGELSFSLQNLTNRQVVESYSEPPYAAIPLRRTFVVKWTHKFLAD